jgi:hypothetical protein
VKEKKRFAAPFVNKNMTTMTMSKLTDRFYDKNYNDYVDMMEIMSEGKSTNYSSHLVKRDVFILYISYDESMQKNPL